MQNDIGKMRKFFDAHEKIYMEICPSKVAKKHEHEFLELAYVTRGSAVHNMLGECIKIQKGNYFIVDYKTAHEYKQAGNEPLEIINCLFLPDFIDRTLKDCRKFNDVMENYMIHHSYKSIKVNPADKIFFDDDGTVLENLQKMMAEYEKKRIGYIEVIRCMLIEIFVSTVRKIHTEDNEPFDDIVNVVINYVGDNYMNKVTLAEIAGIVNYSMPYISKIFKEKYGITFENYLQKTRIEQSCRLLANTDKKIIDIADCVGYGDLKFFTTVFKRFVKMSPREYRRQHRDKM